MDNDSDIMIGIGVDLGPLQEAFDTILKKSENLVSQDAINRFSLGLDKATLAIEAVTRSMGKLGLTSSSVFNKELEQISQVRSALSELSVVQQMVAKNQEMTPQLRSAIRPQLLQSQRNQEIAEENRRLQNRVISFNGTDKNWDQGQLDRALRQQKELIEGRESLKRLSSGFSSNTLPLFNGPEKNWDQDKLDKAIKQQKELIEGRESLKNLNSQFSSNTLPLFNGPEKNWDQDKLDKAIKQQKELIEGRESLKNLNSQFSSNTLPLLYPQESPREKKARDDFEESLIRKYGGARYSLADRKNASSLLQGIGVSGGFEGYANKQGINLDQEGKALEEIRQKALAANEVLNTQPTMWQKNIGLFGQHILQWGAYAIALTAAFVILQEIEKTFQEAIKLASEFQSQSINFTRMQDIGIKAGIPYQRASSNELLTDSIALAERYGDSINDVAEDIQLWYKQTGTLTNAVSMTNEALKVQLATGLDLEDFYRGFTSIGFQAQGLKLTPQSKTTFNLGQSPQLANMMYAASMYGGAGQATQHENDADGLTKTANAMGILLKASEQDTSALGSLKLSMKDIIALNQGMITSMGNFGENADQASERLQRFVGGMAELSKVSNSTTLQKNLNAVQPGEFTKFQTMMQTQGQPQFLENFAKFFKGLNDPAQKVLETTIGNERQFETMLNVVKVIEGSLNKIRAIEGDSNALNKTAEEMQNTYNTQLDKTSAKWQALIMILGMELLPVMQKLVGMAGNFAENILGGIGYIQDMGSNFNELKGKPTGNEIADSVSWVKNAISVLTNTHMTPEARDAIKSAEKKDLYTPFLEDNIKSRAASPNMLMQFLSQYGPKDRGNKLIGSSYADLLFPGNAPEQNNIGARVGHIWRMNSSDNISQFLFDQKSAKRVMTALGENGESSNGQIIPTPTLNGRKRRGGIGPNVPRAQMSLETAEFNEQNVAIKGNIALSEAAITADEAVAGRKGMTASVMKDLNEDYKKYIGYLKQEDKLNEKQVLHYTHLVRGFKSSAEKDKKNPEKETRDILNQASAQDKLNSVNQVHYSIKTKIVEAQNKESNNPYENAMYNLGVVQRSTQLRSSYYNNLYSSSPNLNDKASAISNLRSLYQEQSKASDKVIAAAKLNGASDNDATIIDAKQKVLDLQNDINDKTREYQETIRETTKDIQDQVETQKDQIVKTIIPLTNQTKPQQDYMLSQVDIKNQQFEFQKKYQELQIQGVNQDTLTEVQQMETNWEKISSLAAMYKAQMDALASNPAYVAFSTTVEDAMKLASKSTVEMMGVNGGPTEISTSPIDRMYGVTSEQEYIQAIENEVSALNNKKNILQDIYNAQKQHTPEQKEEYDLETLNIQDQVKNLQQIEAIKKNQLANPSFGQQISTDYYNSFNSQIQSTFSNQFLSPALKNLFGGTGNTQQQLTNAMEQYFATPVGQLIPALQDWSNAATKLVSGTVSTSVNANLSSNVNMNLGGFPGGLSPSDFGSGGATSSAGMPYGGLSFLGAMGAAGVGVGAVSGVANGLAGMFGSANGSATTTATPINVTGNQGLGSFQVNTDGSIGGYNAPTAPVGFSAFGRPTNTAGSIMGGLSAGMAAYGLYETVTQGGGGLQNAESGAEEGAQIGSLFGPWGTLIGAGAGGLLGLFGIGNHDNPADMPDKYDTARFTQYVGELQGAASTGYGPPFNAGSDPIIQALGGQSILAYIQSWIKQNLTSSDPVKQKLANQLKGLYGTSGGGLGFGHDIADEWVKGGSLSGTYVSIYTQAMEDLQKIMTLAGDTATPNQLVALNQFGSSGGGFAFSWNTPGYEAPSAPPGSSVGGSQGAIPGTNTPGSAGATGTGGNAGTPGSPGAGAFGPNSAAPGSGSSGVGPSFVGGNSPGGSAYGYSVPRLALMMPPILLSHQISIPLDGRVLARSTQSYMMRNSQMGYSYLSI